MLAKIIKQSFLTANATVINGVLGLLFYITLARSLGPDFFGIFSICVAVLTTIADISSAGIDTGIIRFVPKSITYLKLGLEMKILIWLIISCLGWIMLPFLAQNIFLKPELIGPLRLSLLGVGGAMLFSLVTSALQALEKYRSWSILNISMNSLRLALIFLLLTFFTLNIYSSLIVYIITPIMGFLVGLLMLPKFISIKNEWSISSEFFHYNKWVALITLISAVGSRIDTFLITRFLSVKEVGIYSAANQLTVVLPQLTFALAAVVAPKLSAFKNNQQAFDFLKKIQLLTVAVSLAIIVTLPLFNWLIPRFLGDQYIDSIKPFTILVIAQLFFFISIPSHQAIFYYFSKPKVLTIINIVNFFIMLSAGLILIPALKASGAAVVILIGNCVSLVVSASWVLYRFLKLK